MVSREGEGEHWLSCTFDLIFSSALRFFSSAAFFSSSSFSIVSFFALSSSYCHIPRHYQLTESQHTRVCQFRIGMTQRLGLL